MAFTALFWGVWHLATGSALVTTSLQLNREIAYELPLAVSRWWDVPFAGVWTALVVLFVTSELNRSGEDLVIGLVLSLVAGLLIGLLVGLEVSLVAGVVLSLVAGMVVGLAYGLVAGLAYGLVIGLGIGLAYGLAFGLAYGLLVVPEVVLRGLVYRFFYTKAWHRIRDGHLAR